MGGGVKQIEMQPDPYRMQAHDVSFDELEKAAARSGEHHHRRFHQHRPDGNHGAQSRDDGAARRHRAHGHQEGQRPARSLIADVAKVDVGHRADARRRHREPDAGEVADLRRDHVDHEGARLRHPRAHRADQDGARGAEDRRFPKGVETTLLFQQKDFIDHAIGNLKEAIRDGAIMVTIVIFLFLLNFRTTFITLMAMPLSFAITMLTFQVVRHLGELDDARRSRRGHRHGGR